MQAAAASDVDPAVASALVRARQLLREHHIQALSASPYARDEPQDARGDRVRGAAPREAAADSVLRAKSARDLYETAAAHASSRTAADAGRGPLVREPRRAAAVRVEDDVRAMLSHLRALPLDPPAATDLVEEEEDDERLSAERRRLQQAKRAAQVGAASAAA